MAAKLTGITVTALGLGALGKPAVSSIMYPVFDYLNVAIVLSLVLVLSSFSFLVQSANTVQAENGNIVLGYYTSWNPPQNLDANKVTHINYAFADVCS